MQMFQFIFKYRVGFLTVSVHIYVRRILKGNEKTNYSTQ